MDRIRNAFILFRIQILVILSFVIVKFILRPIVTNHSDSKVLEVFVYSYPNFCEAIIGAIVIVVIMFSIAGFLKQKNPAIRINNFFLYILSIALTGAYVILQEFKIHNLGGENVYDRYDVLFSVMGLIVAFYLLVRINPRLEEEAYNKLDIN